MPVRLFALVLVASQMSDFALAAEKSRYLLDEDRYVTAHPDAQPSQARPTRHEPTFRPLPADRDTWSNDANGS